MHDHSVILAVAFSLGLLVSLPGECAMAQEAPWARISEDSRTLLTYPFSEPNPVPILASDSRLYPYHSFTGYSIEGEPRDWKVVRLENPYIEVFVLPEVGGKVWGAVVKETGHEFIYRNEVMKFRNIALRGPWTSGGIEFNFGVIGHTPATATPVDYELRENDDGSVSCIVGAMDLPSRTHWRVEIRLAPDKAYFETRVLWTNPTPFEQPYYNWMTAAAFAQDDLVLAVPGDAYLQHSGRELAWPVDSLGRDLSRYAQNTFEGHKSYHVVGELNDFFGGYYVDDGYGFGHWARHEDMPGQKLWLWALSREGGVWEDLLTDTDGQYVEFQAGRLFVQYQPGDHVNPITQAGFDPMSTSSWTETWFPVEGIGGLTDASREGAMHVEVSDDGVEVAVNAFGAVHDTLRVWSGEQMVASVELSLEPLEVFRSRHSIDPDVRLRVEVPALDLSFDSDPADRRLARPFSTPAEALAAIPQADQDVFEARELAKARRYADARGRYDEALSIEPWNREALLGRAELDLRSGLAEDALTRVNRVLQIDAYDARGNFLAGTAYRMLGSVADARDAFGWAARSVAYRSAANVQLAELAIVQGRYGEATRYARLALAHDRASPGAWKALAVVGRVSGNAPLVAASRDGLLAADPLGHAALAETALGPRRGERAEERLLSALRSEYPEQTLLELAIGYVHLGRFGDAVALLSLPLEGGVGAVARAWRAYLLDDEALLSGEVEVAFAFPFRTETVRVLEWAAERTDAWQWRYLLALNLWALDRADEAADVMQGLGGDPDFGPAYAARAQLLATERGTHPETDLRRAVDRAPDTRVLHIALARHLQESGRWADAREAVADARLRFPGDFDLALLDARNLLELDRAADAVEMVDNLRVLPSENARESHQLYAWAHTAAGLDALEAGDDEVAAAHLRSALEWPESLGQGRPYEPEERLQRLLLGLSEERLGNREAARAQYRSVIERSSAGFAASRLDALAEPARVALGAGAVGTGPPPATSGNDLEARLIRRALRLFEAR